MKKIIYTPVNSCCGNKTQVVELPRAIKQSDVDVLKSSGYQINEYYAKLGVLHAQKGKTLLTGSYNSTRFSLKGNQEKEIIELKKILGEIFK